MTSQTLVINRVLSPVRCPGCNKMIAERLERGILTFTCSHCKGTYEIDAARGEARKIERTAVALTAA